MADSGPLWELISFSDCEGAIGPVVSAKLANDFREFDERAKAISGYFYDKYQELARGFRDGRRQRHSALPLTTTSPALRRVFIMWRESGADHLRSPHR